MPRRATNTAMNVPLQKPWTREQFLTWAGAQEGRYEFDGSQPVSMTGGTVGHSVIMGNLHQALRSRLTGKSCQFLGPDAGVETNDRAVRYPDALVTCSKVDREALTVPGAVVVFEVLSPSTSRTDRIVKVREYAGVASIRRYVILETTSIGLTVMERGRADEAWRVTTLTQGDQLNMPEIDIEIPVDEFYDGLDFDPEADSTR